MSQSPRDPDFEVLPPGHGPAKRPGETSRQVADPLAALVAKILDSIFTIPGTKVRFGLDPILGLLPGIGSGASSVVAALMLLRSAQQGVPPVILSRMMLNIIINAIIDAIPVVGGPLSVFFRSNDRNYRLMEEYAGRNRMVTTKDRLIVFGLIAIIFVVIFAVIFLLYSVLAFVLSSLRDFFS